MGENWKILVNESSWKLDRRRVSWKRKETENRGNGKVRKIVAAENRGKRRIAVMKINGNAWKWKISDNEKKRSILEAENLGKAEKTGGNRKILVDGRDGVMENAKSWKTETKMGRKRIKSRIIKWKKGKTRKMREPGAEKARTMEKIVEKCGKRLELKTGIGKTWKWEEALNL